MVFKQYNNWMFIIVKKAQAKINARNAKKYLNEINLSTDNISENPSSTEKAEETKRQSKTKENNELKEGWKDKLLHGKYHICTSDSDVSLFLIHQQLVLLGMQSETEGFIIAAQGQSFPRPELSNEKLSSKHIRKWC